jgi:hypothetical protein
MSLVSSPDGHTLVLIIIKLLTLGLSVYSILRPPTYTCTPPSRQDPLDVTSEKLARLSDRDLPFLQEVAQKLEADTLSQKTRDLLVRIIPREVQM